MDVVEQAIDTIDVAQLLLEQLGLATGLRLARLCCVWRDVSHLVHGHAKLLSATALNLGQPALMDLLTGHAELDVLLRRLPGGGQSKLCSELGCFESPHSIKLLPSGELCVVDQSYTNPLRRVTIFSSSLEPLRELPCPRRLEYGEKPCPGEGRLMAAAPSKQFLFVSYYFPGCPFACGALFKYSLHDFALLKEVEGNQCINEDEEDEDLLEFTSHFAVAEDMVVVDEKLYVCDRGGECGEPSVVVFDMDLEYLFTFGAGDDTRHYSVASPEGELTGPQAITAHAGSIYVAETLGNRVSVFDLKGNFQRIVLCNGEPFIKPLSIAFCCGRLLVGEFQDADYSSPSPEWPPSCVKVLTPDGVLLQTLDLKFSPQALCVDEDNGRVYASTGVHPARLQVLSICR